MKKLLCILVLASVLCYGEYAFAITEAKPAAKAQYSQNVQNIELAFVFDGPSDKNDEVLNVFKKTITRSLQPDYKPVFPADLVFTGDWTNEGAVKASNKALASRARMVISLGYMSSNYYNDMKSKNKYVVTIDQYGLRDFGDKFFNPMQQMTNDFVTFKKLVPNISKTAILMNENYYKTKKDWNSVISKKLQEKQCDLDFVVIPTGHDADATMAKIPSDVDSVFVTPLYNLTSAERQELYKEISSKKLPSFSSVGKEDVALGALLGTSTFDVDKKLAEATSFNIHDVLHGGVVKNEKLPFYDEKVIFYNSATREEVGYMPPLRLLNNSITISNKPVETYDLGSLIDALDASNLDMTRKKYLVSAARRAVASAYMRYLPTFRIDAGYQHYNEGYAKSYSDVPHHVGLFTMAVDQVIYSPDLVSNILVKHKKLKFDKAEQALTKANIEYQTADLYIEMLMLENMIKVQEESVQETRENLAIARVREKTGKCGKEEIMRWAGEVSESEKKLLEMQAEYKNIKVHVNQLLNRDQKTNFAFKPLTASDPALFSSDVHIIDHVRNPEKLGRFTDMLIEEVKYLSPETAKLKAAIAMKKVEIANYAQKFILPNAKLSIERNHQFDRNLPYEQEGHLQMASTYQQTMGMMGSPWLNLDHDSTRIMVAAQWKPLEGGHKIAEIARCKSELNELNAYMAEVNSEIEMKVRSVVNRAISKYFMIEKSYKAMFAQAENYQTTKDKYLKGEISINQISDAQQLYFAAKVDSLNSQYDFLKELIWVQRGLLSTNWAKASDEAKKWMNKIPEELPAEPDFTL